MNEFHLSDETIEEIVDGDLTHSAHLEGCASCRERVGKATAIWREILTIPAAIPVDPSLWSGIQRRIRWNGTRRIVRFLAAAAAVIVIFGSGFLAGTVRSNPGSASVPAPSAAPPVGAATIQRAGTEYVVSLASFASDDPYVANQAREAALAAIHGASIELAKLSPDDPAAAELSRVVRNELSARGQKSPVRF